MESPAPLREEMKSINMISDNKKEYLFQIKLTNDNIEIIIDSINDIPNNRYKQNYSLKQLLEINKYFKIFEKIDDAYQAIIDKINTNGYELKELDKGLSLKIKTNDNICGNFNFELPLVTKSEKEEINELYKLIKTLKTENEKLSQEKKEMINEIKIIKEELENIKKENASIKKTSVDNYANIKSLFDQFKTENEKMIQFGFPNLFKNPKNNCGENSAQFFQTKESYEGSEQSWAHYIVLNHGNGNKYYQVVIRFPFWNGNVQLGHRENGVWKGWKNLSESY